MTGSVGGSGYGSFRSAYPTEGKGEDVQRRPAEAKGETKGSQSHSLTTEQARAMERKRLVEQMLRNVVEAHPVQTPGSSPGWASDVRAPLGSGVRPATPHLASGLRPSTAPAQAPSAASIRQAQVSAVAAPSLAGRAPIGSGDRVAVSQQAAGGSARVNVGGGARS